MKNPFVKESHTGSVIAVVAIGAIAAGAIAYLYVTKQGFAFRKKLSSTVKEKKSTQDYLEKKTHQLKKKTTDLHEIQDIVKS